MCKQCTSIGIKKNSVTLQNFFIYEYSNIKLLKHATKIATSILDSLSAYNSRSYKQFVLLIKTKEYNFLAWKAAKERVCDYWEFPEFLKIQLMFFSTIAFSCLISITVDLHLSQLRLKLNWSFRLSEFVVEDVLSFIAGSSIQN